MQIEKLSFNCVVFLGRISFDRSAYLLRVKPHVAAIVMNHTRVVFLLVGALLRTDFEQLLTWYRTLVPHFQMYFNETW